MKAMKFCIIGSEKPPEIQRICDEIRSQGHTCFVTPSYECELSIRDGKFSVLSRGEDLSTYDIFLFRTGGYILPYLSELLHDNKKVFYEYYSDSTFPEKFAQLIKLSYLGLPVPQTYYIGKYDLRRLPFITEQMKAFHYPAILKGFPGSKGQLVFKVSSWEEIEEILKANPEKEFILQEDLGEKEDIRVIVLHGEVLGGMLKKAKEGEFRTNVAQGGDVSPFPISKELEEFCLKVAKAVRIDFAGIDIMFHDGKPYVLEVNNVPQFQGFESVTGVNVSAKLVTLLINLYNAKISSL